MTQQILFALRLFIVASLIAAVPPLGSRPIAADSHTGSLVGTIKFSLDGLALPGATVLIKNADGAAVGTTFSNARGGFGFENISPGTYNLEIKLLKATNVSTVTIKAGEVTTTMTTFSDLDDEVISVSDASQVNNAIMAANNDPDKNVVLLNFPRSGPGYDPVKDIFTINLPEQPPEITDDLMITGDPRAPQPLLRGPGPSGNLSMMVGDTGSLYVRNSAYHSLQANLQKRLGSGLFFQLTYTFSKSIADSDQFLDGLDLIARGFGNAKVGIFNSKISGHGGNGITLRDVAGAVIQNNDLCNNKGEGVRFENCSDVLFGGKEPGLGNIVGHNGDGMSLIDTNNATIQGNWFGTNPLFDDLGNHGAGLGFAGNSFNNVVGGAGIPASNVFAFNMVADIIAFPGTQQNLFLFNQFPNNTGPAIDLIGNANASQPAPQITSATASTTETSIQGSLNSAPNRQFFIQLNYKFNPNLSGLGGGLPLGGFTLTTNASGNAAFNARLQAPLADGSSISALATDTTTNNTSEFSPPATVTGPPARPDLQVEKTGPETANCNDEITYTITVRNVGTAAAVGTRVVDDLPKCIGDEVEVTTSQGLSLPNDKNFGVVTLPGRIDPGQEVTITIKARLTKDCAGPLTNRAQATADGDRNPQNDFEFVTTRVDCPMITGMKVKGNKVIVQGEGFENGDQVEINGQDPNNTKFKNPNKLVAKGGATLLKPCNPANPGETNVLNLRRRRPDGFDAIIDTQAFATCP